MKKVPIFLVALSVILSIPWFVMPMAGRWDVQDIETQLSADPYSNPEIEADPTTEERLGVQ